MLHLHRSPRLEELVSPLEAMLRAPTDNPLQPEWIVVHGRPTEQWLRARLAQRVGICANVRFLSPSSFVEEVVEHTLGVDRKTVRAWRGEHVMWAVLAAFDDPRLAEHASADVLRRYLGDAGSGSARAVHLARTVAEQFQHYAVVRPTLVRDWAAGAGDAADWQPALWRLVRERLGDAPDPVALMDRTRERLATDGAPARVPRRLAWLVQAGTGTLHLETAAMLASAGVAVHLLLPTPAVSLVPASDQPSRRPLLGSLARQSAGVETLVASAAASVGVAPRVDAGADGLAERRTMLARLQLDVMHDAGRAAPPTEIVAADGSLRVHVCHGAARQADALRDELLRLFDARPDLMPRDVLVLTPDVTGFGPLVQAAFAGYGRAASGTTTHAAPPAIPLRIADRPLRVVNPAMDAALRLLDLSAGRMDAVSLLEFVGLPAVQARFDLDDEAHELLRRWTRESNVRWGIDAPHREAFDVPADVEHTWRFGLDRLLLGWALPGEGRTLFGSTLPYDEVEGQHAEVLGRLAEACERTFRAARALAAPRTMGAWCAALADALDGLLGGRTIAVPRLALDAALRGLRESATGVDIALELPAFRLLLDARCAEPADAPNDGAGAVTLARLAAGRVLPARVICLLGLDDGAFPRPRRGGGFDRLADARQDGDPDPNAEDRQCFLDAVLAARDHLVLTYAGRTCETNERVAPAVPVSELLDAIDATFVLPPDAQGMRPAARTLVEVEHPLQPFSPRNFGVDAVSHDPVHLDGAVALQGARRAAPPFLAHAVAGDQPPNVARVVAVDELARFFANPAKALLAERLRLRGHTEDALETREPPLLDSLQAYQLRDALLRQALGRDADDRGRAFARARAAGQLPHAAIGGLAFERAYGDATRIADAAGPLLSGAIADPVTLDVVVDRWRLVGRFTLRRADGGLLDIQAGTPRAKRIVPFWVRHLALHLALGAGVTSTLVGLAGRDCPTGVCELGPVDDAEALLRQLLDLYDEGGRLPLPFFPETSREYVAALKGASHDDPTVHRAALGKARARFAPAFTRAPAESEDDHVRRAFADPSVALDSPLFVRAAMTVWRPLGGRLTMPAE